MPKPFEYEPSWEHTYDSFKVRQEIRRRRADFERANTFEGSINEVEGAVLGRDVYTETMGG